jgi:osmotically-inducible protein OsmY
MKTDDELMNDIEAELEFDPRCNPRGIVTRVQDGVVILAGHVGTYAERCAAENAAKRVGGVRAIANELDVKPGSGAFRTDEEIAAAAVAALRSHVAVPAADLKVIVTDGVVTLEGKVALWYQKTAAEAALRHLWGVRSIHNAIEIKTAVVPADIKGKIHQTFKRHADLDADHVEVGVREGTVTLTGEVSSWREREDAETAAWSAPGVQRVENQLSVRA